MSTADDIAIQESNTLKGFILPCPVSNSFAIYISCLSVVATFWIFHRFFSTFGLSDLSKITTGVANSLSRTNSLKSIRQHEQNNLHSTLAEPRFNSSEEFPIRGMPHEPKSCLLRVFIALSLFFSNALLTVHVLLSFDRDYQRCHSRYAAVFPSIEDVGVGGNRLNYILGLGIAFIRDSRLQTVVYASSMMLDFSRGFLVITLILLLSDFPGAVYRRLPQTVLKIYFSGWNRWGAKLGYFYAPISLIALILIRILTYNESALNSVLIAQFFLDAQLILLSFLALALSIYFYRKRMQRPSSRTQVIGAMDNRNLSGSAETHIYQTISKRHLTSFFLEILMALTFFLLVNSIANFNIYYFYTRLDNQYNTLPPWLLTLLNCLMYTTIPLISVFCLIVVYPREDVNCKSTRYIEAIKPIFNSIRRSTQSRIVSQTYEPQLMSRQTSFMPSEKGILEDVGSDESVKYPPKVRSIHSNDGRIEAVVALKDDSNLEDDPTPTPSQPRLSVPRNLTTPNQQGDEDDDLPLISNGRILKDSNYYYQNYHEPSMSDLTHDPYENDSDLDNEVNGKPLDNNISKDSGFQEESKYRVESHCSLVDEDEESSENEVEFLKRNSKDPIINLLVPKSDNNPQRFKGMPKPNRLPSKVRPLSDGLKYNGMNMENKNIRNSICVAPQRGSKVLFKIDNDIPVPEKNLALDQKVENIPLAIDNGSLHSASASPTTPVIKIHHVEPNAINDPPLSPQVSLQHSPSSEIRRNRIQSYIEQVKRVTGITPENMQLTPTEKEVWKTAEQPPQELNETVTPAISEIPDMNLSLTPPNLNNDDRMLPNLLADTKVTPVYQRLSVDLSPNPIGSYLSTPKSSPQAIQSNKLSPLNNTPYIKIKETPKNISSPLSKNVLTETFKIPPNLKKSTSESNFIQGRSKGLDKSEDMDKTKSQQ